MSFKYGAFINYVFNTNPRIVTGISYDHDIRQLGKSQNAFLDDNFMSSVLRRQPNYKLTMVDQYNLYFENEWIQGFSNTLNLGKQTIHATSYVPFKTVVSAGDTITRNSLSSSTISLKTHFAWKEKFLTGYFERISLGSKSPAFDLELTYGIKGFMGGEFDFFRIDIKIYDKIELNPIGYTRIDINAGKIYGSLPYPLLKLHEGNETYAFDPMAFNMMNYYEFVSDTYISIFAEHHFQGLFLNRIPLIKHLKLREVAGIKFLKGSLRNDHSIIMELPEGMNAPTRPYYEVNAGLENIIRFIRVDALWRLSYNDNANVSNFGIRVGMQFSF